jgi:hypothetical protein
MTADPELEIIHRIQHPGSRHWGAHRMEVAQQIDDALQGDWEWIIKVLKMSTDRVIDGQRVTLYRPPSFSKSADMKATTEAAVMRQVRIILSTAEVVDSDG